MVYLKSMAAFWHDAMNSRRIEPKKRMIAGRYGWAVHRFPIKDGITSNEAMRIDMAKHNTLFEKLGGKP